MPVARSARERVLTAAEELFYQEGVRAVGIDAIIARSGVAKMSLYRNFASKDDLIVAYLEERNRRFFAWWDVALQEASAKPTDRLMALVVATIERVRRPGYRGCPFLNTAAEFPDPKHPARAVLDAHKREVKERLQALTLNLPSPQPEVLTNQLTILMDGIHATSGAIDNQEAEALKAAAETLIDAEVKRSKRLTRKGGAQTESFQQKL